ncbi:MAG: hypothetical protein IKD75_00010 [Prevotella sp.]|jgi:hypothetical protein|nr:hypothetical protein [Prevotella sp.]
MKRLGLSILTALVLLLSLTVTAVAAEADNNEDLGSLEYNGTKLIASSDFADLNDYLSGMEPGDSVLFTVTLKNSGTEDADFWMKNNAIQSFEDNKKASGGAYTYILSYNGEELYNNETVGGDVADDLAKRGGLHEATEALKEFFFLDTLKSGASAKVTLYVALDGLTQGNSYQDELSKINLTFGVENHTVKTGDQTKTLPFYIALAASGAVLAVVLVVLAIRKRKGGEKA